MSPCTYQQFLFYNDLFRATIPVNSQNQGNPITRSEAKKNTELAKFVAQNQTGSLKPKRTVTLKEKVIGDNLKYISNEDKQSTHNNIEE